jgi:hypothetical protein
LLQFPFLKLTAEQNLGLKKKEKHCIIHKEQNLSNHGDIRRKNMSIFEAIMLLCFGAAWPFSIYKSYTSRSVQGKSAFFLVIVLLGYVAGMLHKIIYQYDMVFYLYLLNFIMVSTDFLLYLRNSRFVTVSDTSK